MSRRRYEFRLWSFRSCVLLPTADLDNIAYPVILLEDTTIIFSDISRLVGFSCKIGFAMRAESRHSMRKEPPVTHRVPSNSRSLLTSRALLSYVLLSPPCLLNRAELKNALRYFLNLLIYFEAWGIGMCILSYKRAIQDMKWPRKYKLLAKIGPEDLKAFDGVRTRYGDVADMKYQFFNQRGRYHDSYWPGDDHAYPLENPELERANNIAANVPCAGYLQFARHMTWSAEARHRRRPLIRILYSGIQHMEWIPTSGVATTPWTHRIADRQNQAWWRNNRKMQCCSLKWVWWTGLAFSPED